MPANNNRTLIIHSGTQGTGPELPVELFDQEADNWCWAACMQMLVFFLIKKKIKQCAFTKGFSPLNCCGPSFPTGCDFPLSDTKISKLLKDQGFTNRKPKKSHISFRDLSSEIDENRPVQAGLNVNGSGHVVLLIGAVVIEEEDGEKKYVCVLDPIGNSDKQWLEHKDLVSDSGSKWEFTWTNISV